MTEQYVVDLDQVDETQVALVGGKGANLGALTRLDGVDVPAGFCVTTHAFRRVVPPDLTIPDDLAAAITSRIEPGAAYAVRSSATAEDLPTASFAGQHDSYLNITGPAEILKHITRCWASLFTGRAVAYRDHNTIDHGTVAMAVVVQKMVVPEASGVLFTADPLTGNRRTSSVEAVPGLGEDLVAGRVTPDLFTVRDDTIITRTQAGDKPALTDDQVRALTHLGRRIEAHFGRPQDIEWCLAGGGFQIVQSRPITTLFPTPETPDQEPHVYVSVGHQQMMTDAMKPLGWSMWQRTAMAPMHEAGGRLFVDVTRALGTPSKRDGLLEIMGKGDPAVADALRTVVDAGFVPAYPEVALEGPPPGGGSPQISTDPAIVEELIARSEADIVALREAIAGKSGTALFAFLLEAFEEHKRFLSDPLSIQAIMAGMGATWWLNDKLAGWLGETNAADTLTLSAPGNITSEMGLALLDLADVIREFPQVVEFLGSAGDDFLERLPAVAGGAEAREAIEGYLDRYGMRCVGEIDITRPRWSERPATLIPVILDSVKNGEPGAAGRRFEQGRQRASSKAHEVLERLRALPDGESKAAETSAMIERLRTFIGYREYPKYWIVCRYFVYKQALLAEAARVFADPEDAFFLTFDEFHDVVRGRDLILERRDQFRTFETLTTPRVLTSDGEAVMGSYRRDDVPDGALVGLPVSAGTVEGRARVVLDMAKAELEAGDILVTTYTDPSWTPVLVAVAGLVTEVGGLMTHGAVIAREYGLPAVVGVEHATRLIQDGQRIRVHGAGGYVELLP
ncbi:pyruvate,water dikinase [Actinoplanes lutulentus]|uniref:Pyruvate,water dikinase n=1 Tax=Actinoplanes lutulentus TaxID=1287878 RepID=A0A327Z231_9ACTN|nr:rifamycin-inactivating phosphotransferase [Actinoplanes lutulentus]MBB2948970.1 pyruvate,water dikinase [Actinoplanes lutulentus]RAK26247.1 pyruvate,water dikinase [Actinoplanes lutulentus]